MRFDMTDSDVMAIDEEPDLLGSISRSQVAKALPKLLGTPRAVNKVSDLVMHADHSRSLVRQIFCLGGNLNDESFQGLPVSWLDHLEKVGAGALLILSCIVKRHRVMV
jgi:hypothetical protein